MSLNYLQTLREFSRKVLVIEPNQRTILEILKDLLKFLKSCPETLKLMIDPSFKPFLNRIWNYTAADTGQSMVANGAKGKLKYELHSTCLDIINRLLEYDRVSFSSLGVIQTDQLYRVFDLIDVKNKHVHCCFDSFPELWTHEQLQHSADFLNGRELKVLKKAMSRETRYGELYDIVLLSDQDEMVSELMSTADICRVPHFRTYDMASLTVSSERCRISHIASPCYVWVQFEEDLRTLGIIQRELNHPSYELRPLSEGYHEEDVIVRLSETGFTFRAKILEGSTALGPDPAQVLAIDFGWTCCVEKCEMFEFTGVQGLTSNFTMACLCRMTDVIPRHNGHKALILGGLKVLYWMTQSPNYAVSAFTSESHQQLLLSLLDNSQDFDIVRHALHVLANAAVHHKIGNQLLEAVTSRVRQFLECLDVMRPVLLFYKHVVRSQKAVQCLTRGVGMELVMEIFSRHSHDPIMKEYFVEIAREVFKDVKLGVNTGDSVEDAQPDNMDQIYTTPQVRGPVRNEGHFHIPTFDHEFSLREDMGSRGIYIDEVTAFVKHSEKSHNRDELTRELYSMLNHKGGVIYVGVNPGDGMITGMKLSREARDQGCQLLIDDMMTDTEILKRTNQATTIPPSLVDVQFHDINNTDGTRLRREKLQIMVIKVKQLNDGYVMFNETPNKHEVGYSPEKYEWKIYSRNSSGKFKLTPDKYNQFRQDLAEDVIKKLLV